jgi:hypothetical protein
MGWYDETESEFEEEFKNYKEKVKCNNCGWTGQFCDLIHVLLRHACPICQMETWDYVDSLNGKDYF